MKSASWDLLYPRRPYGALVNRVRRLMGEIEVERESLNLLEALPAHFLSTQREELRASFKKGYYITKVRTTGLLLLRHVDNPDRLWLLDEPERWPWHRGLRP